MHVRGDDLRVLCAASLGYVITYVVLFASCGRLIARAALNRQYVALQ